MISRMLAIIAITSLAVMMIAVSSGDLAFFVPSNAVAQMKGNMGTGMMQQGAMMGMGHGMMDDGDDDDWMKGPGMTGMGPGMLAGNQSALMQIMGAGQNITGSINLHSVISDAIASQVTTSIGEAASTAEGAVGNNSHALAAHIGETNGYLTYSVWVLGPDMNMNMVIVDPGNGQVLSNIQVQHPMMAGKSFGMGMMGPGMMGMGPGMMGPGMMGMMGPGMMGMER